LYKNSKDTATYKRRNKTIHKHRIHKIENRHTDKKTSIKKNIERHKLSNYKMTKRRKEP